jgi:hypothetical protein
LISRQGRTLLARPFPKKGAQLFYFVQPKDQNKEQKAQQSFKAGQLRAI